MKVVENFGAKRSKIEEKSFILWPKRLDHISRERVERLTKTNILPSLNFDGLVTCVDCTRGKRSFIIIQALVAHFCDNSVVVFYAKINKTFSGFKYLEVKYLIVRDLVKDFSIMVEHIDSDFTVVDPLTKGLKYIVFKRHVEKMGIVINIDLHGRHCRPNLKAYNRRNLYKLWLRDIDNFTNKLQPYPPRAERIEAVYNNKSETRGLELGHPTEILANAKEIEKRNG
ncbi:hypothetical protein CR513_43281, partial [Mucuna pruriens]